MGLISVFAGENLARYAEFYGGLLWLIVPIALILIASWLLHRLYQKISQLRNAKSEKALSAAEAYESRRVTQVWVDGLDPVTGVYFITALRENYWSVRCDSRRHFLSADLQFMEVKHQRGPGIATCHKCGKVIQVVKLNRVKHQHPKVPEIQCICGRLISIRMSGYDHEIILTEVRCVRCGTLNEIDSRPSAGRPSESKKQNQNSGPNSLSKRQEDYPAVDAISDTYTYRNAPKSAVNACVKAIETEGLACNPASLEADLDRIITAAMLHEHLDRQLAQWPKEAADLLAKMESPDELASVLRTKKIVSIIRDHLGPWLK